ncbi:MAG: response regulator, partial [Acetanaerobacterium sp.]
MILVRQDGGMEEWMYNVLLAFKAKNECERICSMQAWENQDGFTVIHRAKTTPEALEYLIQNPVDLVIADINISDMGGITLLKEIRKKHLAEAVVLLGSHADSHLARQSLMFGAFDYMVKPLDDFRFEDLLQRAR